MDKETAQRILDALMNPQSGSKAIPGELEIDRDKGVVYFNAFDGQCKLRICRLPPIPENLDMIDITYGRGVEYVATEEVQVDPN